MTPRSPTHRSLLPPNCAVPRDAIVANTIQVTLSAEAIIALSFGFGNIFSYLIKILYGLSRKRKACKHCLRSFYSATSNLTVNKADVFVVDIERATSFHGGVTTRMRSFEAMPYRTTLDKEGRYWNGNRPLQPDLPKPPRSAHLAKCSCQLIRGRISQIHCPQEPVWEA